MTSDIEKKLKGLTSLLGTDEGFYILALHSFVEYYLQEVKGSGDGLSFNQLTRAFRSELLSEYGDIIIDGISSSDQLGKLSQLTIRVRHAFSELNAEEARAAAAMYIRFCRLAGISAGQQLALVNRQFQIWGDTESLVEKNTILDTLRKELSDLRNNNRELAIRLETYRDLQDQIKALQIEMSARDLEIEKTRKSAGENGDKIDRLRRERFDLQEEKNLLLKEKESYLELQTYLDHMGRLTVYTRSRLDYERLIVRLSPEQEKIVGGIKYDRDYLIRGSAGTGKSLVLISAMQEALAQGRLDFYQDNPIIFVTFTKTLVKYSRFTAVLMKMDIPPVLFSTLDSLVFKNLRKLEPEFSYDFNMTEDFLSLSSGFPFLSRQELAAELDEFLLGRLITRKEYITKNIRREGMHHPLNHEQRKAVWKKRDEYIGYMREKGRYTANYGRYRLTELMTEKDNNDRKPEKGLQTIFIDEVQDMNPAALAAVKSLTTGPLIMAGDFQQSLYMTHAPFIRAGIDIRGTTRILKTNFRNTRQILEAAAGFQKRGGQDGWPSIVSFREGPPVEQYRENSIDLLKSSLLGRITVFLDELGYDPENICILAPGNMHLDELESLLRERNIQSVRINTDDFDFDRSGRLNLSTLHSCKGLDFPVIFLYLPELIRRDKYSPDQTELLLRNLIYTGMTRAMDHLNIFVPESDDRIIEDLVKVVGL